MKNLRSLAILDYVREKRYCSMSELMAEFGVSQATIHRDVAELARRKRLRQVRGGAALPDEWEEPVKLTVLSPSFQERLSWNRKRKARLAELALEKVQENDIVFLDSSTTVFFLAEKLLETRFANLTIVTNAAMIVQNFHKFPADWTLIALGGTFDPRMSAFLGQAAVRELERLSVSKAFCSAFGIDGKNVTTNHELHASLMARLIEVAKHRFLLADQTKSERAGLFKFASTDDFDAIIRA